MKKNIVIIGLNYEYNKNIASLLAERIDMYFLDVAEYINYTLFSKQTMLEKCGVEYLQKQENSALKSCAEFENTIMCMPHMYFLRNEVYKNFIQNSYIVYLYFSTEKLKNCESETIAVDLLVFDDRDQYLKNICDKKINVGNKKIETVVNEIIKLKDNYEY